MQIKIKKVTALSNYPECQDMVGKTVDAIPIDDLGYYVKDMLGDTIYLFNDEAEIIKE
jgi:hypothetical protein